MSGIAFSHFDGAIAEHLRRLQAMDQAGFPAVKRHIGDYMVEDARDNILNQRLFDGSTMLPSKSAEAQTFYRKIKSGKREGKLRKVIKGARLTMQDSGRLRDSFTYVADKNGLVVGSVVEYAAIQHFGGQTGAHRIVAKEAKALRTPFGLFKAVNHPGSKIPARPVLGIGTRQALQIGYFISQVFEELQR